MSNYGLIILSPQFDYLDGGAIPTHGGNQALINLANLTRDANLVVLTRDMHPTNHFSFSDNPEYTDGSWPPHCVAGTKGSKLFPALRKRADYVLTKGDRPVPPDDYSAFKARKLRPLEDLIDILKRHPVQTLIVGGFLLEHEVKYTAFDCNALANTGIWTRVIVPLDCCGTLSNANGVAQAVAPMTRVGIKIVDHIDESEI